MEVVKISVVNVLINDYSCILSPKVYFNHLCLCFLSVPTTLIKNCLHAICVRLSLSLSTYMKDQRSQNVEIVQPLIMQRVIKYSSVSVCNIVK